MGSRITPLDWHQTIPSWLTSFLAGVGGVAGTVHLFENGGLRLAGSMNIPQEVQQAVEWVPLGKGMAGLALERGDPVQTCNLKQDRTGGVKPGARAVNAQAAVALPVRDQGGAIIAVVGVAFADERLIENEELQRLELAVGTLASISAPPPE